MREVLARRQEHAPVDNDLVERVAAAREGAASELDNEPRHD